MDQIRRNSKILRLRRLKSGTNLLGQGVLAGSFVPAILFDVSLFWRFPADRAIIKIGIHGESPVPLVFEE